MKTCPEHNKKFSEKSPNKGGFYWHVVNFENNEYCSWNKEEYDAIASEQEVKGVMEGLPSWTREPIEEEVGPDWDEIRRKEYRFRATMEFVKGNGQVPLDENLKAYIKSVVDFAMTGN